VGEYPGVETNFREKGGDHKTPGVEEAATGCENTSERNWGTLQLLDLKGTREGERAGQRAEAASESNADLEWVGQGEGLPGKSPTRSETSRDQNVGGKPLERGLPGRQGFGLA
jgi:hypothetical protein